MSDTKRRLTINALIENLRQALLALTPHVELVKTPWRDGTAYDDWDAVASALFEALVAELIREAVSPVDTAPVRTPSYDLLLESYSGLAVVEVLPATADSSAVAVFHALSTRSAPFDTVLVRWVRSDGQPISEQLEPMPFAGTRFRVRLIRVSGAPVLIDDVLV